MKRKSFILQKRLSTGNVVFTLVFCAVVIFAFHTELVSNRVTSRVQYIVNRISVNLDDIAAKSIRFMQNVGELFSDKTYNELTRIREENAELKHKVFELRNAEAENVNLKKLLDIKEDASKSIATAKVVTIFADDFSRSCLINIGKDKKISPDDIVFNADGLIGRVIETEENWSKVLLITDVGANIPVRIGEKNINAIISGDNSICLKIAIVHEDIPLEEKQLVVTSGYGKVFEEDMPVGEVIKKGDKFFVKPYVDFNSLKYVNVLRKHAVD